jgi:hypothetical protein
MAPHSETCHADVYARAFIFSIAIEHEATLAVHPASDVAPFIIDKLLHV